MNYYKCKECWKVYDQWQLTEGPYNGCSCGSIAFKSSKNLFFRRLLTDFRYTLKAWIRERLNHGKEC